jgi:hypothetical protein
MLRFTENRSQRRRNPEVFSHSLAMGKHVWALIVAGTFLLSSCGSSSYTTLPTLPLTPQVGGNWQFIVANPSDQTFVGGIQGGFLQQDDKSGAVTGSVSYSVALPQSASAAVVCNSGSTVVTGTLTGHTLTLTAVAGTQTFTLMGALSLDNLSLAGTYSSTAGTATDGSPCGTAQSGLPWSASWVPPLTGVIQGGFHGTGGSAGLSHQAFPVTGFVSQADNAGASSARVTGTLTFTNPTTLVADYPCLSTVSLDGLISGNVVTLQMLAGDGTVLGQAGGLLTGQAIPYDIVHGGNVLRDPAGGGYTVNSPACPSATPANPGDAGNICLGIGTGACTQPIMLTPGAITFPTQAVASTKTQTITLANTTASSLNGVAVTLTNQPANTTNFAMVAATCTNPADPVGKPINLFPDIGAPFILVGQQSCVITLAFTPQDSGSLSATLTVSSPVSTDNDTVFVVPIEGTGSASAEESSRVVEDR